jgi:hypothetical protein
MKNKPPLKDFGPNPKHNKHARRTRLRAQPGDFVRNPNDHATLVISQSPFSRNRSKYQPRPSVTMGDVLTINLTLP